MSGDMAQSCWLLLTLSLKGILASDWSVNLPSGPICAVIGSSVVLPCSYDYPRGEGQLSTEANRLESGGAEEGQQYKVSSVMWCLEESRCITPRYVFHSDGIFPDPSYQSRVQYLEPGTKNCSLRISDLTQSDSGTYVFYLITNHPTQKMPEQSGIQLLVADSSSTVTALASRSSDITEGVDLRLGCCSPAAGPDTRFTWYKNTSTDLRYTGQTWKMSEVTSADSGSYYCQIQTGDKVQKSTMLDIDVQYPPRDTVVSVLTAGELKEGLPVTLTCSSDANPLVRTYTWYQGAACLPTADKSFHQGRQTLADTGRGQTLSSVNVTTDGYRQHCCVARNRHGSQTYVVSLRDSGATTPSETSGGRTVVIVVTVGVLLAILIVVAFIMSRRRKSSTHRSYVLTETTATGP
ncbi:limbic system-associated membrane protein [Thunnus thynnus]|uniref:limbic system-associated membrane protein n=1 Tax=Thunnus thynnus TaxID=8237 RepID=UPI003528F8DF